MGLNIPENILLKAENAKNELLIEICVYLYDKERLSFGQARTLSQLNHLEFQKELSKRDVQIKYDSEDLNQDLRNRDDLICRKAS